MGMPACRLTDKTIGHSCFPPQVTIQGSPNVFIESKPAFRVGDAIQPHCCGNSCHPSSGGKGSMTVFVNGKPLMRVRDPATCKSIMATGARTVKAG